MSKNGLQLKKLTKSTLNLVCQIHTIQEFLHKACQWQTLSLETILNQVNFSAVFRYLFGQHYCY